MKKLISFMILLALSISLFSCAKAPELDSASPDLLVENNVQDPAPVIPEPQPEPQPEQTPDQPENQPEQTPEQTPSDAPATDEKPEAVEEMAFTKDDDFSPFEVAVLLTEEETKKNKTYTTADFEGYDIFSVVEYNCYPEKYYPEHKGKKGLVLYLNEPSKERVLEYCDKLSEDPRIALAEPNVYGTFGILHITIKEEYIDEINEDRFEWFPELDVKKIYCESNGIIHLSFKDESKMYESLKKAVDNKYIKSARFFYGEMPEHKMTLHLKQGTYNGNTSLTVDDFPEIKLGSIGTPKYFCDEWIVNVTLPKPTKKIYKLAKMIETNPMVRFAYIEPATYTFDNDN